MNTFPDVIYIGAPRAGSTWIWKNLSQHPEAWTLPYKSVEYLNNKADNRRRKAIKYHWKDVLTPKHPSKHLWEFHYLFYPIQNDNWYQKLFKPGKGKLKIDISPSCIRQPLERIEYIHKLMPNAKLLLALRNPIERTWSHAMQYFVRNHKRKLESISDEEFIRFFDAPNQFKNGCYVDIVHRWKEIYPSNQMYLYFFEDIVKRPDNLLNEICTFLGIDYDVNYFKKTANVPENYSGHREIPENLYHYLAKKYDAEIRKSQQHFGGYTDQWLIDLEKSLKET